MLVSELVWSTTAIGKVADVLCMNGERLIVYQDNVVDDVFDVTVGRPWEKAESYHRAVDLMTLQSLLFHYTAKFNMRNKSSEETTV
jgi:hypothetical protein